jgi:hypothetical protein
VLPDVELEVGGVWLAGREEDSLHGWVVLQVANRAVSLWQAAVGAALMSHC